MGMEIGHLSWAPSFRGPELALEDEALGFDIRYFGDNTCMHTDVYSEMRDAARACLSLVVFGQRLGMS